jgi:16S rRNA (cytidine1402-2'-O)-methyltransferase
MGSLYVVATPIGNLGDLTLRATETLSNVDVIACEDTRRTGNLLRHIGAKEFRYVVVNEHTEYDATRQIVDALNNGDDVALVSDAGTPGISDPGSLLVQAAIEAGHQVVPIPGASASVSALSVSGMDSRRFFFEGFLPRDGKERADRLAFLKSVSVTTVVYEAPHRIAKTMNDLQENLGGERRVVLARELTKIHEEIWRGSIRDAVEHISNAEPIGEYVILIESAPPRPAVTEDLIETALKNALVDGRSVKDAANDVADMFQLPKRDLYERALRLRGQR